MNRTTLALQALKAARKLRQDFQVSSCDPVCIYDLAEKLNIEVRFVNDAPSLEGMYFKQDPPLILVSAERPPGRQVFTTAHEIGHFLFEHGTRIDEVADENTDKSEAEEYLADRFAAFLLMPDITVSRAFADRGYAQANGSDCQFYEIASYLGVGYTSLVNHSWLTLKEIRPDQAKALMKSQPKDIKRKILGSECKSNLFLVDQNWRGRPVDIFCDDLILVPAGITIEGRCIQIERDGGKIATIKGIRPGLEQIRLDAKQWSAYVRVARTGYAGRSAHRHMEDTDYES